MVKYRIFEPQKSHGDVCIVVGNVFGDTLRLPFDSEAHKSEQTNRAEQLARVTGCTVLAYERPGTGHTRSIFPLGVRRTDRVAGLVSEAAMVAGQLAAMCEQEVPDKRTFLLGASAAGSYAITMTHSQNILPSGLAVFDPVGLSPLSRSAFAKAWLYHQKVEATRPAEHRNHNRAPAHGGIRGMLTSADYVRRIVPEVAHNLGFWSSGTIGDQLAEIATKDTYAPIKLHVALPDCTFTRHDKTLIDVLHKADRVTLQQLPNTYHSWTDDAENFASFAVMVLSSLQDQKS